MVSSEPYFSKILEPVVSGNHFRDKMTVVVDDRHLFGTFMIEFTCTVIVEHEVIIDELPVPYHIQVFLDLR